MLKSREEIDRAKTKVLCQMTRGADLSDDQVILLQGMLVTLNWVLGTHHGSTMQDLVDGRPIEARGKKQ